jgi:hypothetical protein
MEKTIGHERGYMECETAVGRACNQNGGISYTKESAAKRIHCEKI